MHAHTQASGQPLNISNIYSNIWASKRAPSHTSGPQWGHLWLCVFPLLSTWLCCAPHCSHSMPPLWNQTPMDEHPAGAAHCWGHSTWHRATLAFFLAARHWLRPLCFIAGRISFKHFDEQPATLGGSLWRRHFDRWKLLFLMQDDSIFSSKLTQQYKQRGVECGTEKKEREIGPEWGRAGRDVRVWVHTGPEKKKKNSVRGALIKDEAIRSSFLTWPESILNTDITHSLCINKQQQMWGKGTGGSDLMLLQRASEFQQAWLQGFFLKMISCSKEKKHNWTEERKWVIVVL